jgi:hypothetical protein
VGFYRKTIMGWLSKLRRTIREKAAEKRPGQVTISLQEYGEKGKEVGEWCKDRPWGTALVGVLAVGNAERIYYSLLKLEQHRTVPEPTAQALERHLAYYENPMEAFRTCGRALLDIVEPDQRVRERLGVAWDFVIEQIATRAKGEKPAGLFRMVCDYGRPKTILSGVCELLQRVFLYTMNHEGEEEFDFLRPGCDAATVLMAEPAVQFVLGVVVPCWYKHKRLPWEMLASAREGNIEDLKKLLAVDKSVLCDKAAYAHVWHSARIRDEEVLKGISLGLAADALRAVNRKTVNFALAALTVWVSERQSAKVTTSEIRDLFNSYSHGLSEEYLSGNDVALGKAIGRVKREWSNESA